MAHATDSAVIVQQGSLVMEHCNISACSQSCLISRQSNLTCTNTSFTGCSGPCILLSSTGALTSDVFNTLLKAQAPDSPAFNSDATLAQNGLDPAAISLLKAHRA